jgi:hypothetical protein
VVLDVLELLSAVDEKLFPSRVGGVHMNHISFTLVLDIERFVNSSGFDRQCFLIEPPDLMFSSILCLDSHLVVINNFKVSMIS